MENIVQTTSETRKTHKRVAWVDAAKGIAMVLVFYGHLGDYWFPAIKTTFAIVYLFHMPLFFFLSGLFFHARNSFGQLIRRRAYQLLVPYYVFSCLMLGKPIGHMLFPQIYAGKTSSTVNGSAWQEILAIVFNTTNGLWFFWSLFWASLFLWVIIKVLKDNKISIILLSAVLLILDVVVQHYVTVALPFTMNRVLSSTAYVALGYALREHVLSLSRKAGWMLFIVFVLLFASVSFVYILIHSNNWLLVQLIAVVAALCGVTMTVAFARIMPTLRWVQEIGISTLVYYSFNDIMLKVFKLLAFKIVPSPMDQPAVIQICLAWAVLVASIGAVYCLMPFVRKYLWWGIGLRKKE